jgi:LysR family transcriptional regulator, glycine cleavage system transcriptional activator
LSRNLPSLDLLRGFEAAARSLSFTKAAGELFVTQSAVSRQIKALEEHLGVALFRRMNRALLLTDAGQTFYRTASLVLGLVDEAVSQLRQATIGSMVTVTASVSFAALWLVPRLPGFRQAHPGIDVRISADNEILNLQRDRIDLAVRFCKVEAAPKGAIHLFGEEVFPVCSPSVLRDRSKPLRKPEDLAQQVLLHFDDPDGRWPWLNWSQWLAALNLAELKPAGSLRFSHYDQLIRAAVDGEGVALGRTPLVRALIDNRQLAAPFDRRNVTSRQYFIVSSAESAVRSEVAHFVAWLVEEAKRDAGVPAGATRAAGVRRVNRR